MSRNGGIVENEEVSSISTFLQRIFEKKSLKLKKTVLQIAKSLDLLALQIASNINCIDTIMNPYVEEEFNKCFALAPFADQVKKLDWPKGIDPRISFRHNSCQISQELCQKIIKDKFKKEIEKSGVEDDTEVSVRVLDISFVYEDDKTFPDLVSKFSKSPSRAIYNSKLVNYLLNELWDSNFNRIFYVHFVPFVCHGVLTLTWLVIDIQQAEEDLADKGVVFKVTLVFSGITWAFLAVNEVFQAYKKGKEYWIVMNLVDMGHLSLLLIYLVMMTADYDQFKQDKKQALSACISLLLVLKGYDWL